MPLPRDNDPEPTFPFARAEGFTFVPGQANFWNAELTEAEQSIFAADAFLFAEPGEDANLLASSEASGPNATEAQTHRLFADAAMESLTVWLSGFEPQSGSTVDLTLTAPGGLELDQSAAEGRDDVAYGGGAEQGFAYMYVRDPEPGEWGVRYNRAFDDGTLLAPVMSPLRVTVEAETPSASFEPGDTMPFVVETAMDAVCMAPEVAVTGYRTSPGRSSRVSLGTVPLEEVGEELRGAVIADRPGRYTVTASLACTDTDPVIRREAAAPIGTVQIAGQAPPDDAEPPQLVERIADQSLVAWTETFRRNLTDVFTAADASGLSYEVQSSHPQVASVTLEGSEVVVEPSAEGTASILVSAEAGNGLFTETQFRIEVPAFPVSTQRSFTDPTDIRSYRLLSLPGNVDVDLAATLEGEPGEEWRAFWQPGMSNDATDGSSLVEYDSTDVFRFRPGRGFWVLGESDWQYDDVVDALLPRDDGHVRIPVNRGWNIISNPRSADIPWDAIKQYNELSGLLWRWDGGWQQVRTLASARSGEAFYYFHESSQDSLSIPGPGADALGERTEVMPDEVVMGVSARTEEEGAVEEQGSLSRITVGHTAAEPVVHRLPPAHFSTVQLSAHLEEQKYPLGHLLKARPHAGDGLTFDLMLSGLEVGEAAYLHADGLSAFEGEAVVLVNAASGALHDLTAYTAEEPLRIRVEEGHLVQEEGTGPALPLQLLIGDEAFIQSAAERPDRLAFGPVYPNPSSGEVTVEVAVPEQMQVQVEIFNVLGQQVGLLYSGELSPGVHELRWDGQTAVGAAAASGVYLLRLTGPDSQQDTARLTRVR